MRAASRAVDARDQHVPRRPRGAARGTPGGAQREAQVEEAVRERGRRDGPNAGDVTGLAGEEVVG